MGEDFPIFITLGFFQEAQYIRMFIFILVLRKQLSRDPFTRQKLSEFINQARKKNMLFFGKSSKLHALLFKMNIFAKHDCNLCFFLIYFRSDGLWIKTNSQTLKNYISIRINVSFIQGINSTSENVTSAGMSAEIQFPLNF